MNRIFLIPLFAVLINTGVSIAQLDVSQVSVQAGAIKINSHSFNQDNDFYFYPEIQLGGQFFHKQFIWLLGYSYWTDGITEPQQIADFVTYSNYEHVLSCGFRYEMIDPGWFFNLYLTGSFSSHIQLIKYIGGAGYAGDKGSDHRRTFGSFDFGIGINIRLSRFFRWEMELKDYLPVNQKWFDKRIALKTGIAYCFKTE